MVATPCLAVFRHCTDNRILADHDILGNNTVFYDCTGLDDGAAHDNGIFDLSTFFYLNTGEQDRMLDMFLRSGSRL